uniref:MARVEL domain-containing protein n=1 Tax=Steinernema glaseri TaxID=37863 RepID=A0A1I7ZMC2_9BILA
MYETTTTTQYVYSYSTPTAEPVDVPTPTLDTSYLKTLGGMVKCVALVFCMITFLCVVGGGPGYFSGAGFATFVSIFGFMVTLSLLLLYLFRIVDQLQQVPWIVSEMIFCFAWTIFFFIAGSMLAIAAMRFHGAAGWGLASFFAFGAMCTYAFDCYLKFLAWKHNEVAHGGMPSSAAAPKRVTVHDPYDV